MLASQIIRSLPEALDWMVLFDLSTLRRLVAEEAVRGKFFLPEDTDLGLYSHLVLGTLARLMLGERRGQLAWLGGEV